jgi:hypothetical protein
LGFNHLAELGYKGESMPERANHGFGRRRFLAGMAACGAAAIVPKQFQAAIFRKQIGGTPATKPVAEIFLDTNRIHKWDASNGDTWDPFWADDGNLYAFNCDGRGFGVQNKMNLAFNRLAGESPTSIVGTQINETSEYGKGGQKGGDNATWKVCGQECIDGTFYAFVSRNVYGRDSKDPLLRQTATNSSLIKSTDRGLTWTRSASENYDHPMWPGSRFGAPFFIHYGQNGGQISRDGASDYVYAVSTNGFWNDGDSLILGRVTRSLLPSLNSSDWEYHVGGDGRVASSWSADIESAVAILDRPAKCGQTPVCYVPALGIYLLISWYNTATMTKWFQPNEMRYDFYQSAHPWDPWSLVDSFSDSFMGPKYHMYGPSLCARFQETKGTDVEISLFTAGCPFADVAITPYKVWHIPVLLRTTPMSKSVVVAASDAKINYEGVWFPWTTVEDSGDPAADDGLPRASQTAGSSAELSFAGTGVEFIAQKSSGQGNVDIYLDGVQQESANLDLEDFPVFFGVVVFSKNGLSQGKHVIKVVNASDARVNLEGFRVYT